MKKIIACLLLTTLASACTWHLRGSVVLPLQMSQLYISAIESKGALISELRQLLKSNHVSVVEDATIANYSLNILDETKDRRTAGVGGDALSSSYEITIKANYEISIQNNSVVTKGTAISVRSFNYNTASINSATQEEVLLDQEMRRDLAQQMLRRLGAVIANPPVDKAKANNKTLPTSSEINNGQTAP